MRHKSLKMFDPSFGMEESSAIENDLLIDKLLKKSEEPEDVMSLTADLLKQRQELQTKIDKDFIEAKEKEDEENSDGDNSDSSDDSSGDDSSDDVSDSDGDGKSDDKSSDDEEDLDSLVGSGLGDKEGKEESKEESKEEASTESHKEKLNGIFLPILEHHNRYYQQVRQYGLESSAVDVNKQPVVYVKESVLTALENLLGATKGYIENNQKFISTTKDAVTSLAERITVTKTLVDKGLFEFTNTLVSDKDILKAISVPGKSDPRELSNLMLKYRENVTKAVIGMTKNDFDLLVDSFLNSGFSEVDEKETSELREVMYDKTLPGFSQVKLSVDAYKNYITVKIGNFQFYKIEVSKTEDLYNLPSVGIDKERTLEAVLDNMDKLLMGVSEGVDNIGMIVQNFEKLIERVKALIYDINEDKYEDLTQIGIDKVVQDFIKFKLAVEVYYITHDLVMRYITGLTRLVNECVKLKSDTDGSSSKDEEGSKNEDNVE